MTRCRDIASNIAAGSTSRNTTFVEPQYRPTIAQPEPAMWNIGITAMFTLSAVKRHSWVMPADQAEEVRSVSITPLGRPVVPEV